MLPISPRAKRLAGNRSPAKSWPRIKRRYLWYSHAICGFVFYHAGALPIILLKLLRGTIFFYEILVKKKIRVGKNNKVFCLAGQCGRPYYFKKAALVSQHR